MLGVYITNTGEHPRWPDFGDYEVVVSLNGNVLERLSVKDHDRRKGWRNLLRMIAATRKRKP